MSVKIGINIHPVMAVSDKEIRPYSSEEKQALDAFLLAAKPDAILVMNDIDWARRFAIMLPDTRVIFRLFNKDVEGELWKHLTAQEYFDGMKAYQHPRIILNIGNEPLGKDLPLSDLKYMVAWYFEVMHKFGDAGISVAVPAWGTGNPDFSWFQNDTYWAALKPLFSAFQAYPLHYLNLHSYFTKNGLQISNGNIGRHEQIAAQLRARQIPVPNMLITEYGSDNINQVPGPWMDAFGQTDEGEDRYGDLIVEGRDRAFNQPYVKGLLVYPWGAYAEWRRYDISKATRVQKRIVAANAVQQPDGVPPPITQPPPAPPEPPPPNVQALDTAFCDIQITALTAQLDAWKRLREHLAKVA